MMMMIHIVEYMGRKSRTARETNIETLLVGNKTIYYCRPKKKVGKFIACIVKRNMKDIVTTRNIAGKRDRGRQQEIILDSLSN
jgi:hypothetical protein